MVYNDTSPPRTVSPERIMGMKDEEVKNLFHEDVLYLRRMGIDKKFIESFAFTTALVYMRQCAEEINNLNNH